MSKFSETGFPRSGLKGMGASFDKGEGNYLQHERDKPFSKIGFNFYNQRFCEHCKQSKPKGKRKAVKGWKCDNCLKC
jgi:hypothetical protein